MRRHLLLPLSLFACTPAVKDDTTSPATAGSTASPSSTATGSLDYPQTRRDTIVETLHGKSVADPYRWLEDVEAAPVQSWMAAQDTLARDYLSGLPHRDKLEQRLIELTYIDSVSPPWHRGDRYFYSRSHADKEKGVFYFKNGRDGKEQVLIDPNTLSEDGSISVVGMSVSHDGRYVAYKLSENNADASTMYLRDLDSGNDSKIDVIPR
nr:S9 family peptidase [Deltaproteobacteria bacterium]